MNYGDLGKRFVASLIDGLVISAICGLLWLIPIAGWIIMPFASMLYYILMEGSTWHATLGKKAMSIYVADETGRGISYQTAILRVIGKLLCSATGGIGYIIGLFNDKKQGLHDMLAKTVVLNGEPRIVGRNGVSNMPEIICISGPLAGRVYPVGAAGTVIGRDSVSCQIVLPSTQANVSRAHCVVTYNASSALFVINDRKSTYGTFLANGARIPCDRPAALKSGDRFYVATRDNMFEVR